MQAAQSYVYAKIVSLFFPAVNILMSVACQLLGPQDTLPCVLMLLHIVVHKYLTLNMRSNKDTINILELGSFYYTYIFNIWRYGPKYLLMLSFRRAHHMTQ